MESKREIGSFGDSVHSVGLGTEDEVKERYWELDLKSCATASRAEPSCDASSRFCDRFDDESRVERFWRKLGERVFAARTSLGWSVKDFARVIGAARAEVLDWELGARKCEYRMLKRMSDVMEIDLNWLLWGETDARRFDYFETSSPESRFDDDDRPFDPPANDGGDDEGNGESLDVD